MEKTEKSRIGWVDAGRGLCMIFVMFSHTVFNINEIREFYGAFFLTGFFFLSGFVYNQPNDMHLLFKRIKRILTPWAVFSAVIVVLLILFGGRDIKWYQYILYALIQIKDYNETLWFLPCIAVSTLILYLYIRFLKGWALALVPFFMAIISKIYTSFVPADLIPWGTVNLPWHLNVDFIAAWFMLLGYLYKLNESKIKEYMKGAFSKTCLVGVSAAYVLIVVIGGGYSINDTKSNVVMWLLTLIVGLIFLLEYSKCLAWSECLCFIGKNSLLYYCLHTILFVFIDKVANMLRVSKLIGDNIFGRILFDTAELVLGIIVLIPLIVIINKHFAFIIGKKSNK